MPFQIHKLAAYRELVLDELRKQANIAGTRTNSIVLASDDYDSAIRSKLSSAQGCYNTLDEVLWYCYCYMPLHFDVFQKVMQLEEDDAGEINGDTFRQKVFNTDGNLLVVDVGCGPMTAGLALADWYSHQYKQPLKLSYVGIDDSAHCTNFAANFAARRELFDMPRTASFYKDCNGCNLDELRQCVTNDGTVLFICSYVFGQNSCKVEHVAEWASFVREVMSTCNAKNNLFAYTNISLYEDPEEDWANSKYKQFRNLLKWHNPPKRGRYARHVLRGFREPGGPVVRDIGEENFCHLLVDAKLVNEDGLPIRKGR